MLRASQQENHFRLFFGALTFLITSFFAQQLLAKNSVLPVIVAPATFESRTQPLEVLGTLKAKQSIEVRSSVNDILKKIYITDGAKVNQGDLLFELSDREEFARLEKAQVVAAEAKRQFQRAQKLRGQGNITVATIDELKAIWESAKAEIQILNAQISDRLIKAPFDGTIGLINVSVGDYITANTQLTTLDDSSSLLLDLTIPSQYRNDLRQGQTIQVFPPAPATLGRVYESQGKPIIATVTAISPRLTTDTRLLPVRAEIQSPGDLKSGMVVKSQIQRQPAPKLWVPNSAILMVGERKFVYRLRQATLKVGSTPYSVEKIEVKIGERLAKHTQIIQGLKAEDIVVSQGVIRLSPNAQVAIKAIEGQTPPQALLKPAESQQ